MNEKIVNETTVNAEAIEELSKEERERQKIIRSFFKDDKLASIPAKASKRAIVFEEVAARCFENGKTYTEQDVNSILRGIYEDHCTLRRELVDAGLMKRDHGEYTKQ